MHEGGKALLIGASFVLVACTASPSTLQVRAIPNPALKFGRGGNDLDTAKAYLALGSVGLALEGFRKVQRDQPANAQALAGIAACYQAMSRYDLAQQNYEAALALTPRDAALLTALAAVFEREGKTLQAISARADAARLSVASAAAVSAAPARLAAAPASSPVAQRQPPAVAMPAPRLGASVTVDLPPARPVEKVRVAAIRAAEIALPAIASPTPSAVAASAMPPPPPVMPRPWLNASVTVDLPPARPAETVSVAPMRVAEIALPTIASAEVARSSTITVALPPLHPAAPNPNPANKSEPPVALSQALAPRLERLSRGEVALVTTGRPIWGARLASNSEPTAALRWVPIQTAAARPNIQIFNAARRQGIAAATRNVLTDRGWRRIAIGDAPMTRSTSVVFYPAKREKLGRSLAAQFGFRAIPTHDTEVLVVVLGRDAPGLKASANRG